MVEIHGGGLISGSSHMNDQNIVRNFVSQEIVFSSIEYRMGWLGFFTTFTDDFPPNLGMLDQVMALRFINEEIWYFGGDTNRITILGQSAGGHSVSVHSYSPLSQNLFQQYIAQSGTVLTCYEDSLGPTSHNIAMAEQACNFTQDMWNSKNFTLLKNCLYNIDAKTAQTISQFLVYGNAENNFAWYTRQNVEGNLLWNFASLLGNGTVGQQVIKIWEDNYLPSNTTDDDHLAWLKFQVAVETAAFFGWGALRDIEYYVQNNNPDVYAYNFVWSNNKFNISNYAPAPHGCEDLYLFNYGGDWNNDSKALASLIQGHWVNFVKTGNPTTDNSWQPTKTTDFSAIEYFQYNITGSTTKTGYRAVDDKVWNQLMPPVLGDYPPNLIDTYPVCPKGYTSKIRNNTCYEAFGTKANWTDAQNNCVNTSYGSLVSIGSAFENSDVLSYATQAFPTCEGFYIGLFTAFLPAWVWVNYDPSTYRNWQSGQPGLKVGSVFLSAVDGTWVVFDEDFSREQCYICGHSV